MFNIYFHNTELNKIIRGEIKPTESAIQKALENKEDRDSFIIWATQHMDTVIQSKTLRELFDKANEIDLDSWHDPLASQAFVIGKTVVKASDYIKKWLNLGEANDLDEFAVKCRSRAKMHSLDINDLKNLVACYEGGLLNFEEVSCVLHSLDGMNCSAKQLGRLCEKSPESLTGLFILRYAQEGRINSFENLQELAPGLDRLGQEQKIEILLSHASRSQPPFLYLNSTTKELTKGILPRLIERGLELNSEKYLEIKKENYADRINLFRKLLELNPLEEAEKIILLQKLQDNERQEQRLLLQYTTRKEKEQIKHHYDDPYLPTIIGLIVEGQWMQLIRSGDTKTLPYCFLAAYCQKKIDLEDLATAMMYYRAYSNQPDSCTIYELNEHNLKNAKNLTQNEREDWLRLSEKVKPNQRNFIAVNASSFDKHTSELITTNFLYRQQGKPAGSFDIMDEQQKYAIVSFGLAKADCQDKFINLSPILHLTPRLEPLAARIALNYSDFALFLPDENPMIHGSDDKTIFGQIHDLFHAEARSNRLWLQPEMMTIVKNILREIKKQKFPSYRKKLFPQLHKDYDQFAEKPSQEELIHFLIINICGEFIDSSYPVLREGFGFEAERRCKKLIFEYAVQNVLKRINDNYKQNNWEEELSISDLTLKLQEIIGNVVKPFYLS